MPYVPSDDSDQPGRLPSLIRVFVVQYVAKDTRFFHGDSEGSDQTGRMPKLIWVFVRRTGHSVGFVMVQLIYYWEGCNVKQIAILLPLNGPCTILTVWPIISLSRLIPAPPLPRPGVAPPDCGWAGLEILGDINPGIPTPTVFVWNISCSLELKFDFLTFTGWRG